MMEMAVSTAAMQATISAALPLVSVIDLADVYGESYVWTKMPYEDCAISSRPLLRHVPSKLTKIDTGNGVGDDDSGSEDDDDVDGGNDDDDGGNDDDDDVDGGNDDDDDVEGGGTAGTEADCEDESTGSFDPRCRTGVAERSLSWRLVAELFFGFLVLGGGGPRRG